MTLPVAPVTRPSDIAGLTPAQIGVCHLSQVYFPGVGHDSLHKLAARAWTALTVAALAEGGWVLTCAGWGSALRSFATQERAFFQRYVDTYNPLTCQLSNQRTYQGKRWYLKRGQIPCAVPGTGNHPLGLAIDGALYKGGKILAWRGDAKFWAWLKANVLSFGLSFEIPEEGVDDPHVRYTAGDHVPQRVLDIEAWCAAHGGAQ